MGASPLSPIPFIFMQFAAKIACGLVHPLLEIVDPSLSITYIIFPLSRLLELERLIHKKIVLDLSLIDLYYGFTLK